MFGFGRDSDSRDLLALTIVSTALTVPFIFAMKSISNSLSVIAEQLSVAKE